VPSWSPAVGAAETKHTRADTPSREPAKALLESKVGSTVQNAELPFNWCRVPKAVIVANVLEVLQLWRLTIACRRFGRRDTYFAYRRYAHARVEGIIQSPVTSVTGELGRSVMFLGPYVPLRARRACVRGLLGDQIVRHRLA
jgi:hypothetical protein